MAGQGTREEITIGVVGGDDFVRRLMAVARETGNPSWRLVSSAYTDQTEAWAHAIKIAPRVDVCLFGGPLPHDLAVSRGDLPVPATYVPVGGSALYSTLLRAKLDNVFDLERITIDSASDYDVWSAYKEVGLDPREVRVQPYVNLESADRFLAFHQDNYVQGRTTGAITTVPTVATALAEAGVPALFMRATPATLRHCLHTAALMGSGARLGESRIVTMVVRIPSRIVPAHISASNYWYQDLKLSLQRELLREARMMDAALLPRDEHSFLIITTMGSLRTATDDLTIAPFLGRVADELSLELEVGVGLGRSTREAEFNAQAAVDKAAAAGQQVAYLVGPHDTVLQLPADRRTTADRAEDAPTQQVKAVDTLGALAVKLAEQAETDHVVDAVRVAELLGVTLRTARKTLRDLVDAGLAWQMPPARSPKVGRPPQLYQLLVEKLP
jgi:hypothetical protein